MHRGIGLALALSMVGCTGNDFDIGAMAGDYLVEGWIPGCVVHVSGSKVTATCPDTGDDGYCRWNGLWTLDFTYSENRVDGTEAYHSTTECSSYNYESNLTRMVSADKISSGSGSGPFAPVAGVWTVNAITQEQYWENGTLMGGGDSTDIITAEVSGSYAIFRGPRGATATVTYSAGRLTATGDVNFSALH